MDLVGLRYDRIPEEIRHNSEKDNKEKSLLRYRLKIIG
jgi:hypothetical protein